MKVKVLIVLIVFAMTIVAPFKINVNFHPGNKTASILTLDVCDGSGSALSARADIPCVLECPCALSLIESSFKYVAANSVFTPFLIAFQQERPPKT